MFNAKVYPHQRSCTKIFWRCGWQVQRQDKQWPLKVSNRRNTQSQEHLFTVNSVVAWYPMLNIALYLQIFDISKYFDRDILKNSMDTPYKCGITGKLYRLWYNLYKDSQIKMKTAAGLTCVKPTGENFTQGSICGAILRSANLDKTMCHILMERMQLDLNLIKGYP